MAGGWYTEVWANDSKAARESKTYPDFKSALKRLDEFKSLKSDDIFRIRAPSDATSDELRQIANRGAQLL